MTVNRIKYLMLSKSLRKKWTYDDFLYYHMQEKRRRDLDSIMTPSELQEAEKQLNNDACREIFNSKRRFLEHFNSFISREYMFLEPGGEKQLEDFIRRNHKIILKPDAMYAGIGVCMAYEDQGGQIHFDEVCPDYFSMCEKGYVAEQYVPQHEAYSSVYSGSLNTIRVTTLLDTDNRPKILFAVNQFGSGGSLVDNNDDTAIWCLIDIDSGKIIAVDNDKDGKVNEFHPDSGMKLIDFENINFDKVKALALKLALICPDCRLIGWDIAVKKNGDVEVIEGNVTPELDLYQVISGKGLREELNPNNQNP